MNVPDIEQAIFSNLYNHYFLGAGKSNLNQIRDEFGCDNTSYSNIIDRRSHEGLLRPWTLGGNYRITPKGVLYAEEHGMAPEHLVKENQRLRTVVLDNLAQLYEAKGRLAASHFTSLASEIGTDEKVLTHNLLLLEDLGYVEQLARGSFRITHQGIDAVTEWQKQTTLADEFESISKLKPQPRGRALQKLFAKVIEQQGWSQEEGVRTSHEEMDVIIFREREYYLVECKWEKNRIEASVIRELYGKLSNRVDVRGIVVSMSGFTEGAITQAEEYAGQRVILLFGDNDIRALVVQQTTFNDLLNEKYRKLITQRKIMYS